MSTTDSYPEAMKINLSSTSPLSFQEFKCTKHPNIRTIDEENYLSSLGLKFSKAHLIHLYIQLIQPDFAYQFPPCRHVNYFNLLPPEH